MHSEQVENEINTNCILLCPNCKLEIPSLSFQGTNSSVLFKIQCCFSTEVIYLSLKEFLTKIKQVNMENNPHIQSGQKYCSNCMEWIIKEELHRHKQHILLNYELIIICHAHQMNFTDFCTECQLNICEDCIKHHQQHKMKHINNISIDYFQKNEYKIYDYIKKTSDYADAFLQQLTLENANYNMKKNEEIRILLELNKTTNNDLILFLKYLSNTLVAIDRHLYYQLNNLYESITIREYKDFPKEMPLNQIYPLFTKRLQSHFIIKNQAIDPIKTTSPNQVSLMITKHRPLSKSQLQSQPLSRCVKSCSKKQTNLFSIILPEKERLNRIPGCYEDLFSQTKLKHNTYILHAIRMIKEENINNGIVALILDGKQCRTTKALLTLGPKLKKISIVEINSETYDIIRKFCEPYSNITVFNQHINQYFNNNYDPYINVIYFDVMCSYTSSESTKGTDYLIKQFLKCTKVNEIIFAATFCLRNGSGCQFQEYAEMVVDELQNQFIKFQFQYTLLLLPDEIIYKGQTANAKSMMFVIYHLQKNNE